jgi:hypothetical protein
MAALCGLEEAQAVPVMNAAVTMAARNVEEDR